MKTAYIVLLKPKFKDGEIRTITPHKKNIKWTKKRAIQAVDDAKKNLNFQYKNNKTFEYALTEVFTISIVTENYAKKKGHI